jgi:DNA topoisomerase-3
VNFLEELKKNMSRQKAKEMILQAKAFKQNHPDIYAHLLGWAKGCVSAQMPITAERMNLEVINTGLLIHSDGRPKSFPHALRAVVIRMLARDAPEIRPFIKIAKSKVDEVFDFIDFDTSEASANELRRNTDTSTNNTERQSVKMIDVIENTRNLSVAVIAEKPVMQRDIVEALAKTATYDKEKRIYTFENWQFLACRGHMLSLVEPAEISPEKWGRPWRRGELPIVVNNWPKKPTNDSLASQVRIICAAIKDADIIYHAGDPDDEGQLLVDEILEYAKISPFDKRVYRVYINDSLPQNIIKAFKCAIPNANCANSGKAAYARQMADMSFGVSHSRLISVTTGMTLNLGRVLTPTLGLVYRRDKEIENHIVRKYYNLYVTLGESTPNIKLKFSPDKDMLGQEKHIFDENVLEAVKEDIKDKSGSLIASTKTIEVLPPLPYSLSVLQSEMSDSFGLSAEKTQKITQSLRDYHKAITYNRTDSQYLKDEHFAQAPIVISAALASLDKEIAGLDFTHKQRCFDDTKVTAHHAIIPVAKQVDITLMTKEERIVYEKIAMRYVAQFMPPAIDLEQTFSFLCVGESLKEYTFKKSTKTELSAGFRSVLSTVNKEGDTTDDYANDLAALAIKDGTYLSVVDKSEIIESQTTPNKPYTEGSLIADMANAAKFIADENLRQILIDKDKNKPGENGGIGTVATRAEIIKHLFDYGYCVTLGGTVRTSQLGKKLFSLIPEELSGVEMTARWWIEQEKIAEGTSDVNALQLSVSEQFKRHEHAYDDKLHMVRQSAGSCPLCGGSVWVYPNSYRCENNKQEKRGDEWINTGSCTLSIVKQIGGYTLKEKDISELLKCGVTRRISGFKSKENKKYSAVMYLDEAARLRLKDFANLKTDGKKSKG